MKLQKIPTIIIGSLLAIGILATVFTWHTLRNHMMPIHTDRITIMAPWMLTWTDDSAVYDYNSETHLEYEKAFEDNKDRMIGRTDQEAKDPSSIFVINRSEEAQRLKHSNPYKWTWAKTYNTEQPPENSPFTWGRSCSDAETELQTITLFKFQESRVAFGGGGGRTAYICGDSYIVSDYINHRGEIVFGPYTIK